MDRTDNKALVHWTYTHEEWKAFLRWRKRKKGWLPYLMHRLGYSLKKMAPEITITSQRIWTNNQSKTFSGPVHQLRRVNIMNARLLNVLELVYWRNDPNKPVLEEIQVLVPKGKLREAMTLYAQLQTALDQAALSH